MGTWREGCYTEDSVRHVTGGSGNTAFLLKGKLRHLARAGSATMFTGPGPVLDILFYYVQLRGLWPYF
jgi:hypothetical protein